jgi:hypothetical protein
MANSYYPLDYFLTRPDARKCLSAMAAYPGELTPSTSEAFILGTLVPRLRALGWSESDPACSMATVSQEMQGMLAWADWALRGKNVLSVDEALCHAFEHSDCADLRIQDVLPDGIQTLYLHFKGQLHKPIDLGGGAMLEGAYVISHPEFSVRVVLCARAPADVPALSRWRERYDLRIAAKYYDIAAEEAIDLALANDLADLRLAVARTQDPLTRTALAELTRRMTEGHGAYRSALRLVLNTLAYWKHYATDSLERWPETAPPRLAAQAQSEAPKERARGLSKLWALGFVPITFMGEGFAHKLRASTAGGTLRAHWRRGHWRNQLHGPAFSLRKLIWLQPTLVGADR